MPPSRRQMSPRSLAIIADLQGGMDVQDCANKHEVSRQWVTNVAQRAGINLPKRERVQQPPLPPSPKFWTEVELDYLVAHERDTNQEIAAALGRSEAGVRGARSRLRTEGRLGNRKPAFTAAELAVVDDTSLSHAEVAERLGRSYGVIIQKRQQRGTNAVPSASSRSVARRPRPDAWTPEMDQVVIDMAHLPASEIAGLLQRTAPAVAKRRTTLAAHGLVPHRPKGRVARHKPRIIAMLESGHTTKQISEALGVDRTYVSMVARGIGIKPPRG